MRSRSEPVFIMGDSSNVLFDTRGFNGLILRISRSMSSVRTSGSTMVAQAGVWMPYLARRSAQEGLSGLEHAVGIPGTLGGLVLMNGGSQRLGIGNNVLRVQCVTFNGEDMTLSRDDCNFSYRKSSLQFQRLAVVEVQLELTPADPSIIRRDMINILRSRRTRFPKNLPNGGSTFLSDPTMYSSVGAPGAIIERIGFKGLREGGAQISTQHANFIVNNGGATSFDVLRLVYLIRQRVQDVTGFRLDCEVQHVRFDGVVAPAHVAAHEHFELLR